MMFKHGQQITPVKKNWLILTGPPTIPLPEFGKIYTVREYPDKRYPEFLSLNEFPMTVTYKEAGFAPLVDDKVLEEDLKGVIEFEIYGK